MMVIETVTGTIVSLLFEYDTAKLVHIRSKTVGIINRLIQLLIIGYIIGYVLVYKKGYQEFSSIESAVTAKLKGVVYTDADFKKNVFVPDRSVYNRLWDAADYVVPPQENGAFFVLTNAIITSNQTQEVCPEAVSVGATCESDENCTMGSSFPSGNGVMTGRCVPNDYHKATKTCEVKAWCPVEYDELPTNTPLLLGSSNFTVLIKNSINFPLWKTNSKTRNVLATSNTTYLTNCEYDSTNNPSCPIFRLGTIVEGANENYFQLATTGGVIAIVIHWDCNLDYEISKCIPKYSFRRLDNPDAQIAKGWNFRYANYFDNGKRTLIKAYGILFMVFVEGRGGKFSLIPLLTNVGAGLALLSVAVVICDIIVLYLMKKRAFYREKKYLVVDEKEEFQKGGDAPIMSDTRARHHYSTFYEDADS